jgi:prepilin-type N-terminal cleavage/methylation domain-containing protein
MLRNNDGLSLIEMLVVLILSSMIMAASYKVFIGGQQVYVVQDQVADMQQNVRAGLDRMTREIRMAGYGKDILSSLGNISGFTKIITPGNNVNNIGKNDDQITIIIADKAITYGLQWDTKDPGMPVLVRRENGVSEIMADNIDGLQFSYTLKNGTVTDSPVTPENIQMVRINLIARTKLTDPQLGGDGYRRRALSSLTIVRNLGI